MVDESTAESATEIDDIDQMQQQMADRWRWVLLLVIILAGLAIGYLLSRALIHRPTIAIVRLYDQIDYGTSPYFFAPLQQASERDDIAAVVILVDSPGGYSNISEQMFYAVRDVREKKPVVVLVEGTSASGSYYASVGANYIIALPSADIGSIGVIAELPTDTPPDESIYATGPYKGGGNPSNAEYIRDIETIKQVFLANVYDQRTYTLAHMHNPSRAKVLPDRETIATGQVWIAPRAYEMGLIDAIGSDNDAFKKAAELAGISHYVLEDLTAEFLGYDGTYIGSRGPQRNPPRNDAARPVPWNQLDRAFPTPTPTR